MSDLDASMASMGFGGSGATSLANAAFGSRISNAFSGVNSAIQQMVTGLTKAAKLTAQIKKDTADISKALGHSLGTSGVGVVGSGGVGAGSSMNLGLAAVSAGGGGGGVGGGLGLAGFGGGAGGAGGISSTLLKLGYAKAGLGAAAGLAQMALAPGVAAYGMMPATSDVLMRNRLMFNSSLGSGMMANSLAKVVTSSTFGRMGSTMDGYQSAAALASVGYGVNSALGRNMLRTTGSLSFLTGQSGADIAGTLSNNIGSPQMGNRLRMLGISTVGSNGDPMSFSQIGNQVYNRFGFSGLSETQIQRELRPGMAGNLNLDYYFQDPQMRSLVQQYLLLRARNGGKPVNMSSNAAMSAISGAGGGVLGADKSLRNYAGTSANMIEAFGSSLSGGISTGANIASNINNTAVSNQGLLQGVAQLKGSIDTLTGTSAGQGVIAGAATGLKGFTDVLSSATTALAIFAMSRGLGAAGGATGGLLGGAGGALGTAARVGGGVLGGLGAGAAGVGATEALRGHFASNSTVGNGSAWQTAGTIAGYAGSGAAAGALIGSVVPGVGTAIGAVAGTAIGAGLGVWRTVQGGGAAGGGSGGAARGGSGTNVSGGNATSLLSLAKKFVGTPYVWGGTSPRGWDCSGFTQYVFGKIGVRLGRTTYDQAKQGTQVSYSKAQPGDLLFYHYAQDSQGGINHVAIYLGGGRQVAAANRRVGTVIQPVDTKNLVMVRRVLGGANGKASNGVADDNNSVGSTTGSSIGYQTSTLGSTDLSVGVSGVSAHLTSLIDMLQGAGVAVAADGGANGPTSSSGSSTGSSGSGPGSSSAAGANMSLSSVIKQVGFKGNSARIAYAIAMAESGGDPHSHNPNPPDNSYGYFQINMLGDLGPERRAAFHLRSNDDLYNPLTNAKAAYEISNGGKNWIPWTTYTSGKYKEYLSGAPSYSKGAWNVNKDQAANLHTGEMVLPASVAQAVRDNTNKTLAGQGPGTSGGAGPVVILNVYPSNASNAEAIRFGNKVKEVLDGKRRIDSIGAK